MGLLALILFAMSASPALSHFDLEPDPTFLAAVASFRELRIFETPFQRPGPSEGLPASEAFV
jgi:hypothetical protein